MGFSARRKKTLLYRHYLEGAIIANGGSQKEEIERRPYWTLVDALSAFLN